MKSSGQSVKQSVTVKSKLFLKAFRQGTAFPNSKPRIISSLPLNGTSFFKLMFNQECKSCASFRDRKSTFDEIFRGIMLPFGAW